MSSRQHKSGGRHARKKSRRPLPLPKRPLPDMRKCVSPRDDEDYVNLGHRHKLTIFRYPSGSGRPPPKPKRVTTIQEVGSPPPSLDSPPNKPAPRPPPKQLQRPKALPHPTSPSQQMGVTLATPTDDAKATPTGRPSRPLLPPKKKLQKVQSAVESTPERDRFQEPKRVPPKLCPKPLPSPDPLSADKRYSVNQESLLKLNGYTNDVKKGYDSSLPAQTLHASTRPPKPLAPPPVKPRKPRPSFSAKKDKIKLNLNDPGIPVASLQQKLPASPPFLTSPKRRSHPLPALSPDQETNGRLQAFLPYVSELQSNMKGPMPKPRPRKTSRGEDTDPSSHSSQAHPAVEEGVVSPTRPTARRRLNSKGALPTPNRTEDVAQYPDDDFLSSTPVCAPPKTPRGTHSAGEKCAHMQVQAPSLKAPPTPRRSPTNSKMLSESEDVQRTESPASHHQHSLRTRRKGGGIRMPLWKAPPPPTWTPPQTPPGSLKKNSNKKERSSFQLLLPLSSLHVSPPTTPTSTSFILPPFRSYGQSYPSSDELARSWVVECEPMVEIARSSCSSPTPKSPLTVEFEEDLFNCRRGPGYPGPQQQLPINVVQELQNNLRKQIMTRS